MKELDTVRGYWNEPNYKSNYLGQNHALPWMLDHMRELVTSRIPVHGKTVLDFGCGGAVLGMLILSGPGAARYVGYDVSDVSVKIAKENLKDFKNAEVFLLTEPTFDFKSQRPDIFASIACMIHFVSLEYLTTFLAAVNECGAEYLVLEICDKGQGTSFPLIPTNTRHGPRRICLTNEVFVSKNLPQYVLTEKTDPKRNKISDQFLWYRRR